MVAIDGKTWTITPAGAAACLSILETAASVAYGAAKQVATRAVLGAVFAMLDPTQIGSSIDETHRLSDGTKLHVTGQSDELVRHVLVTLPNGQNISLVLLHNGQGYSLQSGTALGATLSPSMLADMAGRLSRGGVLVVYNGKTQNPPVPDAVPGRETKGRSQLWEKSGGQEQAEKDFENLGPKDVKTYPNGVKVGSLGNGDAVIIRPKSSDGRPTLEIQSGKTKIKVRYD